MAIGDRLRKKIRNRREKAGEVTGKKKYSVMGKSGGRATGTRWVRKKKKKEEPETKSELKPDAADMSYTPGAEEQMFRQQVSEEINDAVEAKIKSLFQNIIGR